MYANSESLQAGSPAILTAVARITNPDNNDPKYTAIVHLSQSGAKKVEDFDYACFFIMEDPVLSTFIVQTLTNKMRTQEFNFFYIIIGSMGIIFVSTALSMLYFSNKITNPI